MELIHVYMSMRNQIMRLKASFLGLVNHSARFIPNFPTLSELLRKWTKKAVNFERGMKQAFNTLKTVLARDTGWVSTTRKQSHK